MDETKVELLRATISLAEYVYKALDEISLKTDEEIEEMAKLRIQIAALKQMLFEEANKND